MGSPGAGNKLSLSNVSRALGATLALSVVSIILGIALLCVILFFASGPQPPTDRRLLDHYTLHKTEFGQLAEMFTVEEELLLVYPDDRQCETVGRQHVEAGYSERCDEYLRLFRSLELGWAYVSIKDLKSPVNVRFSHLELDSTYCIAAEPVRHHNGLVCDE